MSRDLVGEAIRDAYGKFIEEDRLEGPLRPWEEMTEFSRKKWLLMADAAIAKCEELRRLDHRPL